MEKLRFVELANELLRCPLCEFIVDKAERKKAYNHASKKHQGRVSSKLIKSPSTLEEKAQKTKVLSYNRVKKFRLLKKLRTSSLDAEGNSTDVSENILDNDTEMQQYVDSIEDREEDADAAKNNEGNQWISAEYDVDTTNDLDDMLPEVTLLLQLRSDQSMRI